MSLSPKMADFKEDVASVRSLPWLYVLCNLCVIVGVILSYTTPLHTLSLDNNPTRSYYWNRVTTSDNTYYYSDGADYQTQVCWYAGEVLIAFMTIALVCTVLALFFLIAQYSKAKTGPEPTSVRHQATLTAAASILYTLSIVNWATSCLNLTKANNASTVQGQTLYAAVFIVMIIFSAVSLVGAYVGWKRHQQEVLK